MQNKLSGLSPAAPTTIYGKLTVHRGIQFPLLSVGDGDSLEWKLRHHP